MAIIIDHNSTHKPGMSVNELRAHAAEIRQIEKEELAALWITIRYNKHKRPIQTVIVALGQRAHLRALELYAAHWLVVSWDEFYACAQGVAEVEDPVEREQRLGEALAFFAKRQNLNDYFHGLTL